MVTTKKTQLEALQNIRTEIEKVKKLPQVDIPVTHVFSEGVYIRKIDILKDTLIVGKRHRNSTCNMLVSGTLVMMDEYTKETVEITGPFVFTSPSLCSKILYGKTNCVFITIHPTYEKDIEKLEDILIISDEEFEKLAEETTCRG